MIRPVIKKKKKMQDNVKLSSGSPFQHSLIEILKFSNGEEVAIPEGNCGRYE